MAVTLKPSSKYGGLEPTPITVPEDWTAEQAEAFVERITSSLEHITAKSPPSQISPDTSGITISDWMEHIDTIRGIVCRFNTKTGERIYRSLGFPG